MEGPKHGELWTIGAFVDFEFATVARDLKNQQYFVFVNKEEVLVITKDEFFDPNLKKTKR